MNDKCKTCHNKDKQAGLTQYTFCQICKRGSRRHHLDFYRPAPEPVESEAVVRVNNETVEQQK